MKSLKDALSFLPYFPNEGFVHFFWHSQSPPTQFLSETPALHQFLHKTTVQLVMSGECISYLSVAISSFRCRMSKVMRRAPRHLFICYIFPRFAFGLNWICVFSSHFWFVAGDVEICTDAEQKWTEENRTRNSCQMSLTFPGWLNEPRVCVSHNSCHCGWLIPLVPLPLGGIHLCSTSCTAPYIRTPLRYSRNPQAHAVLDQSLNISGWRGKRWWHLYLYIWGPASCHTPWKLLVLVAH